MFSELLLFCSQIHECVEDANIEKTNEADRNFTKTHSGRRGDVSFVIDLRLSDMTRLDAEMLLKMGEFSINVS